MVLNLKEQNAFRNILLFYELGSEDGADGSQFENSPRSFQPQKVNAFGFCVDLSPLEYLSRRVTIRLCYLEPKVGQHWREDIHSRRVRIWSVAGKVMEGWKKQMAPGLELAHEDKLWKWIKDNVDFRVRARSF